MNTYSLKEISSSVDRFKIYTLLTSKARLEDDIRYLENQKVSTVDIGREIAIFLDELEDYRYISEDVQDFTLKLLARSTSKIHGTGNPIIAIYNLGILLEPALGLDVELLFKQYSKSAVLILIWEHVIELNDVLNWPTQKNKYFLDFTDIQLKRLQCNIKN